jgi:hypothetical protein
MLLGLIQGDQEYISHLILQVQNPFPAAPCRSPGQGVVAERCKNLSPGVGRMEFEGVLETELDRFWEKLDVCLVILQEVRDFARISLCAKINEKISPISISSSRRGASLSE